MAEKNFLCLLSHAASVGVDLARQSIGALDGGALLNRFKPTLEIGKIIEILALPFDVDTLRVRGTPIPVIEDVLTNPTVGSAQFTASGGGSIAYIPGGEARDSRSLVWVDSRGAAQPVPAPKRNYEFPRLSPDGQRLAVRNNGGSDSGQDIWLYQFGRGTLSRFTSKANDAETPIWTPDGKRVAYAVGALRRVTFDDGRRVVRRVPGTANGS